MINIDCTHILDIAKKINAEIFCYKDVFVDKISTNSKEVGENFCFWAIRGANFDGNEFIVEAISNGATAIVTDVKPMENISVLTLYVDNTVKAVTDRVKHDRKVYKYKSYNEGEYKYPTCTCFFLIKRGNFSSLRCFYLNIVIHFLPPFN